ncbi:UDP-2,4-diacetamido-2,4,6-trideoxy-beta-L-altropyranose hydrolase [Celeribacter sp.]|uniref:UDP-2,4-diacetamido-2,4, 6-trideoxy-beta-L-altropyranose hydrolase n=1 Tax=Celeribacter sp. TaxID=1890673 RepID=UPI003A920874
MKVVFRADASVQMGTGHVMRCLTLAKGLRERGHDCRFVCRDLNGHLGERVVGDGFDLTLLPAPSVAFTPAADDPAHSAWAEVAWDVDAAQTRAAAPDCDWLVVDHYAFDARWQKMALCAGAKLAVIDDLADRPHIADLLLDQNLGRLASDYDGLVPDGCIRLIGPRYALLRPEFARLRDESLARREGAHLDHILISMGGVDKDDATSRILMALAESSLSDQCRITVVMGRNAPWLDNVRSLATTMINPTEVVVDVTDMAALMVQADLAIGAAGGTSWERCALGLPTLIAVLADNQMSAAAALASEGAAIEVGGPDSPEFSVRLSDALHQVQTSTTLNALSQSAACIADGRGATRVVNALEQPLTLRRATMNDAEVIWTWRDALPASHFHTGIKPSLADHLAWFSRALDDPYRRLYVAGDPAIAHLRLDVDDAKGCDARRAVVSIILAPEARGGGLGVRLLAGLADIGRAEGLATLIAEVQVENEASLALFQSAGYAQVGLENGFCSFRLDLF